MSIVPYSSRDNWRVILRRPETGDLVVYDDHSGDITHFKLRDLNADYRPGANICPLCGHVNHSEYSTAVDDSSDSSDDASTPLFHSDYFRLLQDSSFASSTRSHISNDAFTPGYFERFFKIMGELGRGSRGAVYLVEHLLDGVSLGEFACKRIPVGNDHQWLQKVLREVQLLQVFDSNIVHYNHVWLEEAQINNFGPRVACVFILQEYCNAGTLEDYVLQHSNLPIPLILSYARDITSGINSLHANKIIHCDLKPSNCLLRLKPGEVIPQALVSDFGEGLLFGQKRTSTGATGTLAYLAPELLKEDVRTGSLNQFSYASDVYALGLICYYLCFKSLPYSEDEDTNFEGLRNEILTIERISIDRDARPDVPAQFLDIIEEMLAIDADIRPTAETVLQRIEALLPNHMARRRLSSTASNVKFAPSGLPVHDEKELPHNITSTELPSIKALPSTETKFSRLSMFINLLSQPRIWIFVSVLLKLSLVCFACSPVAMRPLFATLLLALGGLEYYSSNIIVCLTNNALLALIVLLDTHYQNHMCLLYGNAI
ncbi:hypothetical protein CANCADRAFT_44285 [Tortispora caseinolytica NRRL Y-17796]|uniref:non-specific serine/threonine protein kinase n=1 Tax=Tortispora caseinolytica NRRL Y-17796 TaxID=767744 RepID=A0A1E4TG35_9ASCO|nr:hypothetical protein CANCADRAFT_44285 [Tortispora caseinolytica NRRL Y-17796]